MTDNISRIRATLDTLLATPAFQRALDFLEQDAGRTVDELKTMAVIPGAPYKEHLQRSPMYKDRLEACGATGCRIDEAGNVTGRVTGTGSRPQILLEAHLDTVFPEETPLVVTEKQGFLYCPGISDDTASLACILSLLRAIRHAGLQPAGDIVLGGTVGEEGEGNSRGIRHLLEKTLPDVDAVISLECFGGEHVCLEAIGIRRCEYRFHAQGGHSWYRFGVPNPFHAMGRGIARIADIQVPQTPRTTFSVGIVSGGTSINTIPQLASMKIDMRSVDMAALNQLAGTVQTFIEQGVAEENARWPAAPADSVRLETLVIGSKPAGALPKDSLLARLTCEATVRAGFAVTPVPPSSTNQNIPLGMGIPAVVIGGGGICRNMHTLEESYSPKDAYRGAQRALLMLFALAGLDGVTEPLATPCPRHTLDASQS